MKTINAEKKGGEMDARRGFKGYESGERKQVRKADVKEDQVLGQLKEIWKKYLSIGGEIETKISENVTLHTPTRDVQLPSMLKEVPYSSKDVEAFSMALTEFQHVDQFSYDAGKFLNALIENCKETDFVIHTGQMEQRIDYLGLHNDRDITITVIGGVGRHAGACFRKGKMIIKGDAWPRLGSEMMGGEIHVHGYAHPLQFGFRMTGGEIHLFNDDKEIDTHNIAGGKVYHNGNLIFDAPEKKMF